MPTPKNSRARHLGGETHARKKIPDSAVALSANRARELLQKNDGFPSTYHRPKDLANAKLIAITAMRRHGVLSESCRASQIGRNVVYELFKEDPTWRKAMAQARRDRLNEIERCMMERATMPRGDLAGIFILKHNVERYREVQRVELGGVGGGPVQYLDVRAEMLRRLAKLTPKDDVPLVVNGVEVHGVEGSEGPKGLLASGSAGSAGSRRAGSTGSAGSGVSGSARGPALVPDEAPRIRKADTGALAEERPRGRSRAVRRNREDVSD